MHLERILQSQGFGSRKECRSLIRHGRVTVAGVTRDDPFADFPETGLEFSVDGTAWRYREKAYLMLHKPAGHECSRSSRHHASVYALLPAPLVGREVQSVGRLDEDTTGLLLFSDDGQFIHRLISPRHQVAKTYRVTVRHVLDDNQLERLRAGVELRDDPAPVAAAHCRRLDDHTLLLAITEGRYHQVKRMLAAVGNRVEALARVAIGGLVLPSDLPVGAWRWLEAADLERLEQPGKGVDVLS